MRFIQVDYIAGFVAIFDSYYTGWFGWILMACVISGLDGLVAFTQLICMTCFDFVQVFWILQVGRKSAAASHPLMPLLRFGPNSEAISAKAQIAE